MVLFQKGRGGEGAVCLSCIDCRKAGSSHLEAWNLEGKGNENAYKKAFPFFMASVVYPCGNYFGEEETEETRMEAEENGRQE